MPSIPVEEVQAAFPEWEREFPPVLSLEQAARLAHCGQSTLKAWISEGRFRTSTKRRKPLLFWRNRFVAELFATDGRRRRRGRSAAEDGKETRSCD
jgi:hypothetical protein